MKQSIFVRVQSWNGDDIYMNTQSFELSKKHRERLIEAIEDEIAHFLRQEEFDEAEERRLDRKTDRRKR